MKDNHLSRKIKFWLVSLSIIILLGVIIGNSYEILRRRAKAMRGKLKEDQILQSYISAKNKNDIYNFAEKFKNPDTYGMDKIVNFWEQIGFMSPVPYLMFQYRPNIRTDGLNTNDMGYRGRINFSHLPSVRPDINYRYILFLGGSVAFGAYSSSDEKCISSVLEKKLNTEFKSDRKFKVINLGMSFYNSFQELISYMLYGLKYNPEVVITLDGFNDAAVPMIQKKSVPMVSGSYYESKKALGDINNKFIDKWKKKHKFIPSIDARNSWEKESADYVSDVTELYRRNLELIYLVARENGSRVLLTLQPIKIFPDGRFAWEDKNVERIYKILPSILEDLASKYGVKYLNFQKIFAENLSFNQYFVCDPVHLSDRGQEIIATYMFNEIKDYLERGK